MIGTAARGTSVVRRFALPAVVLLVAAASVLWWSRHADDDIDLLPCERLDFPCTFAEVPRDVLERSLALGGQAVERLRTESPAELAGWLREQPGVVEVLQSDTTVAFRLQGGRRIWLQLDWLTVAGRAPRPSARHGGDSGEPSSPAPGTRRLITISPSDKAAPPPGRATWANAARALTRAAGRWGSTLHAQTAAGPARRGGVVGIDLDNDGAITQRDPKRALILAPDPYLYGDEAREVEALLKGTSGYDFEDSVDVRLGPRAGVGAFQIWNDFDLVHVATRGPTVCSSPDEWWMPHSGIVGEEGCGLFLLTGWVIDPADVHGRVPRAKTRHSSLPSPLFTAIISSP